jgi:hypothetical protein
MKTPETETAESLETPPSLEQNEPTERIESESQEFTTGESRVLTSSPQAASGASDAVTPQVSLADANSNRIRQHVAASWVVDFIRGETLKRAIQNVRDGSAAKKNLPAVCWSGIFNKKRANDTLERHSGLLCADLDKGALDKAVKDINTVRVELLNSPHLWCVFVSPSGRGLKAIFRVPADKTKHLASWRAVEKHIRDLTGVQIDESCKDVARLCFLTHDPDTSANNKVSEIELLPEPGKSESANTAGVPLRERIARELLGDLEWSDAKSGYFVDCPGENLHDNPTAKTHSIVYLIGAPTIKCQHNSCAKIVEEKNKELRSRIGKAENSEKEIEQLAALPLLDYDRQRDAAAGKLGCRASTLDKLVATERAKREKSNGDLQGTAVLFEKIEPWPEAVSGANVLDAIAQRFTRYVALPGGASDLLALWCAHTHVFDAFVHTPRLNITAPSHGCGKTTLRDVAEQFVARALKTENMSPAVLFRLVEKYAPVVLADEYDSWLPHSEELRGLLNAGHRRGGMVHRCEGDDNQVRSFKAFAPVVLCGIGSLPGTLVDRSIVVKLARAKRGEIQARFDDRRNDLERELLRKLARWTSDIRKSIEQADPILPDAASNRVADNWRPLFALAEAAGETWASRCAKAFELLTCADNDETENLRIELLADIRRVVRRESLLFVKLAGEKEALRYSPEGAGRIFTFDLLSALVGLAESPWGEVRKGDKPINDRWLSRALREFKIRSKTLRIKEKIGKGYELADFSEAFSRYLPHTETGFEDAIAA